MKSVYALAIGILVSASAIAFFKGGGSISQLFSNSEATDPRNDSASLKKKKPVNVFYKKRGNKNRSASRTADWLVDPFLPTISAIKTVDKTTEAVGGDVLNYTVVISNTGTDATGLTFTDDIDPNTTFVSGSLKTSPIAVNDAYTALGNVGMSVPAENGILSNDELGTNLPATFAAVTNAATAQGGTISINTDGGFTYTPAAGFTGDDTYTYTLTNDAGSSTGTVSISVSGMIWFVNNNSAAATADGRLNTPFKTVTAFQAVNDGVGLHPNVGHSIFVYESATAYDGNITLLDAQKLIGQDATSGLTTITGYTGYTYSTALLPAMNSANATFTNLTASGATNVVSLNGGISGSYTIRGLTIGNKVTGSGITGTSFGTLNASEVSITGTGQALALTTGVLNATFSSLSSSSGGSAVSLTGIGGTATIGGGSLSGSTGTTFNVSGGTIGITYDGNISQSNNAPLVSIAGSHNGTITFQNGTLNASNGTGLQFNTANGTYNFNGTTTLNGGDAGVDILGTSLGNFSFSANTTITDPSGTAFSVGAAGPSTGGSGSITYNGTITKTNGGRTIEVQNKNGGTVAFTGSITSTGVSSGINLLNNTGAFINFSGGLTINTATNAAFTATGGGTITATQNNTTIVNTITTTTGLAVNVANTTIGNGGLAFRSINVNGANKAVSLNTTGAGGFTISGNGTAGSGGTIQNISTRGLEFISANNLSLNYLNLTNANTTDGASPCDDNGNSGCNAAIYISNATGVALSNLNVTTTAQQGLNLNGITTLTINNCTIQGNGNGVQEGALKARNILGTSSITNSLFKNSAYRIAHVINTSGSAHLTIDGCTFTNDAFDPSSPAGILKQDCFEMRTQSTATATVLLKNSSFTRAGSYGIQLAAEGNSTMMPAITNCTVDRSGQQMAGIAAIADGLSAVMNANIDGNPIIQSAKEVAVNVFSGLQGTMQATVRNNGSGGGSIQGGNNANANPFANVFMHAIEQSNGKVLMTNNKVEYTDQQAIQVATHDGTSNTLDATVENNTVITQNTAAIRTYFVMRVLSNTLVPGSASPTCANIKNNALTLTNASGAPLPYAFEVETGAASSQIKLQSNSGTDQNNITNLWVNNGNTPTNANLLLELKTGGSTINYGGFTCQQPTNTVLPLAVAFAPLEENVVNTVALADVPILESTDFINAKYEPPVSEEELSKTKIEDPALQGNFTTVSNVAQSIVENTTQQNITVSGINLPASKSLTIKFQVTVNTPLPTTACSISNQGSVSGAGITTVLTDNDANTANGINPTVTTILDITPPEVNNCPSTVTVQTGAGNTTCTQTATWTEPTATDNCSGPLTFSSRSHAPGSLFPVGPTEVTYVFKDAADNPVSCTFYVVVEDKTPPVINSCPGTVTVQTGAGNTTCSQTATWIEPTATDNCGTATLLSRSHQPGAAFSAGTTPVTYVFRDVANNESSCTFNVVVEDKTPPVINSCPGTINVKTGPGNTTCTQTATWTEPNATDACSGTAILVSRSHEPGAAFSKGTTTVTYVFRDVANNQRSCSFDVVVEDNTPPLLTCPQNVIVPESSPGSGSAIVEYPVATATDNCSGIGTIQYSQASGTTFPVGTTTVEVSVTDAVGNPATCSFSVTVSPSCQITCPIVAPVNNTPGACGANVNYNPATISGDCGLLTYSHPSGSFFPVGKTTVTVSSESSGAQCQFDVIVIDNEAPKITSYPTDKSVCTDPGKTTASVTFAAAASDNCPGVDVTYFIGATPISSPHEFPIGETIVTIKATDAADHTSQETFKVEVKALTVFYADDDEDGYGDPGEPIEECSTTAPAGYVTNSDDCNDDDENEKPGQVWYIDEDGDRYGNGVPVVQCSRPANGYLASELIAIGGDCNDEDADINPATAWYIDADGDSYSAGSPVVQCVRPANGFLLTELNGTTDCNDDDDQVWRQATLYADADNDGYTTGSGVVVCYGSAIPAGYRALPSSIEDCNDNDATVYQGQTWYRDVDGDGYAVTSTLSCGPPAGAGWTTTVLPLGDCNDGNNLVWQQATLYVDADSDGYTVGNGNLICYGATVPNGYSLTKSAVADCNDNNAAINPGAGNCLALSSLTLINANTDADIQTMTNNMVIDLAIIPGKNINIRANTLPPTIGSVIFKLTGQQSRNQIENQAAYALYGNTGNDYNPWKPQVGSYTLLVTPYTGANGSGTVGTPITINFQVVDNTPTGPSVNNYTLFNATSDASLGTMTNGMVINLATIPGKAINIRANTSPSVVGSVRMVLSGQQARTQMENQPAYALFGNTGNDYNSWKPQVGQYVLTSTAYTAANGGGTAGTPLTINFSVVDNPGPVVNNYTLFNATSDASLGTMTNNMIIDLATIPGKAINIRANTSPATVGSVRMVLSGPQAHTQMENQPAYALFGNTGNDYNSWKPQVGQYVLTSTAYTAANGGGTAGTPLTINFTVVDNALLPAITLGGKNGDGEPEGSRGVAGLRVYPNPVVQQGWAAFSVPVSTQAEVRVVDVLGRVVQVVYSGRAEGGVLYRRELRLQGLARGMYFVRLVTTDGKEITQQLLYTN